MKIDKAIYIPLLPTGAFLNERIGLEASLDEGEDPIEVLYKLKALVKKFHQESNPQLDGVNADVEKLPEQQIHAGPRTLVDDIMSCKEVKVLETYKIIVRNKPELQGAYNKKMEELSK